MITAIDRESNYIKGKTKFDDLMSTTTIDAYKQTIHNNANKQIQDAAEELFKKADSHTDEFKRQMELDDANDLPDDMTGYYSTDEIPDYEGHAGAQLYIGLIKLLNLNKKQNQKKRIKNSRVDPETEAKNWVNMAIKNGAVIDKQYMYLLLSRYNIKIPPLFGGRIRKRRSSRKKMVKKSGRKTVNTNKKSKKQTRRTRKHKRRGTVS